MKLTVGLENGGVCASKYVVRDDRFALVEIDKNYSLTLHHGGNICITGC